MNSVRVCFLILLAMTGHYSMAANNPGWTCTLEDAPEEFVVEIDLTKNIASFFDNNDWATVPLIKKQGSTLLFEGKDRYGMITISFNKKSAKGSIYYSGAISDRTFSKFACETADEVYSP